MLAVPGVIVGLLVLWLFSGHGPTNAGGATTAKFIDGIVYDLDDQRAIGAEVTVEIWGGDWPDQDFLRTSQSTVTDVSGRYEVEINANYWRPHNTIWVYASDGQYQGQTKVEADAEAGQTVDVHLVLTVPEFDTSAAIVLVSAVIIHAFLRVRTR